MWGTVASGILVEVPGGTESLVGTVVQSVAVFLELQASMDNSRCLLVEGMRELRPMGVDP